MYMKLDNDRGWVGEFTTAGSDGAWWSGGAVILNFVHDRLRESSNYGTSFLTRRKF